MITQQEGDRMFMHVHGLSVARGKEAEKERVGLLLGEREKGGGGGGGRREGEVVILWKNSHGSCHNLYSNDPAGNTYDV